MEPNEDEERRRRSEAITNAVRGYGRPPTGEAGRTGHPAIPPTGPDYSRDDDLALVRRAQTSFRLGEVASWALVRELCRRVAGPAPQD